MSRKKPGLWDRLLGINYWLRLVLVLAFVPIFYYTVFYVIGLDVPFMVVALGSWVFLLVAVGYYQGWKN